MRRPHGPGTGLALSAVMAVLVGGAAGASAQGPAVRAEACMACHLEQKEERLAAPARDFATEDVHGQNGLDCLSCHGGGAGTAAMIRPERQDIPVLCDRCHGDADYMKTFDPGMRVDQLIEYRSSAHGRGLAAGDADVATCADCHPPHRILPPDDTESSVHPATVALTCGRCHADVELMAARGHRADQQDAWRGSVHGRAMEEEGDLSAPTCNDCHGNHGAAPPGVASVRNVCGQCHATVQDFFTGSGHVEPFVAAGLPGCTTCHEHHAIEPPTDGLLLSRAQGLCGDCHDPGEPGALAFVEMHDLIDELRSSQAAGHEVLLHAEDLGMEVSQALFELEDVGTALTKARTAVHTLSVEPVREEVAVGLDIADRAEERGRTALREHKERRYGLAMSAGLIALLVVGLVLKINDMEGRAPAGAPPGRNGS
ncbi:MAG: cytochrome c3 family protein [Gemmatimonadota bacterium]